LRRRYPQIYQSTDRLLIDVSSIRVTKKDFFRAMREIVPSAHRTSATYAKSLNSIVSPLLSESLEKLKQMLEKIFPFRRGEAAEDSGYEDDEVDNNTLSTLLSKKNPRNTFPVFRPRILLYGKSGMGQSEIGGALLYLLEEFPVSAIDIATLFSNPATKVILTSVERNTERSCLDIGRIFYCEL
jgi:SpoVK/Ycf46/Vps4 family AAA+-type ATPase